MNSLALISIIFGALLVVFRFPLIIAPQGTKGFYAKLIATNTRIRIRGVAGAIFGVLMILIALQSTLTSAFVLFLAGCFITFVSVFLYLIFTSTYKKIADFFFESDAVTHRVVAFLIVGMGVGFICLSLFVFRS